MKSARFPRKNTNHNVSSRWKKNTTFFFSRPQRYDLRLNPAQKTLNSFHSNVTKCCACQENCKHRITKCCACHENCKDRITKCCTCHENCKGRITKCCACRESCEDRITKCCACHENCKDRITKCCACHKNCKGRITKCCACHENCKSRITKKNSPKWIGWMEARWIGFSFWLNIYHSWFLPWRQKQALFWAWKRASEKATGTVGAPAGFFTSRRVTSPYRCTHAHAATPIPSSGAQSANTIVS